MRLMSLLMFFFSLTSKASPMLSTKERLRLHLWVYGLEEQATPKKKVLPPKSLPEEIERSLRKI